MLLTITFISGLAAILTVNWVYFKILRIAKDKKLVDNPDARKLQKDPVPVMGGIAVFLGVVAGVFAGSAASCVNGLSEPSVILPVVLSMVIMLYVGAMDDIQGLSPQSRFVIEILVILGMIFASGHCIDSFDGMWGIDSFSWWVAVPLTVFAGVGIINAINMIDGVNGLSSGLCITCSALFCAAFVRIGDVNNAILAFSMAAALVPFFIHNVFGQKSRMFIGDAGTMVMGVLMTWFTMYLLSSNSCTDYDTVVPGRNLIAYALAVLSVPVFDTLRVMTMRILHKRSPFKPDKTHLHHAFVTIGMSHSVTTVSEILINVVVVIAWYISARLGAGRDLQLYIVIVVSVLLVWGVYAFLSITAKRHTELLHKLTLLSVKSHLGRKDWWKKLSEVLDAPEEKLISEIERKNQSKPHLARRFDHVDPENRKEMDRKAIIDFMKGRAEVFVEDIRRNSGADPLRVYPILFEEIQAGYVTVIRESSYGAPDIVTLSEE